MTKLKKIRKVYMAGSMEGRTYESLFYEHYYVRQQLVNIGLDVFDPLLKESHKPGKLIGLKHCGINPKKVYFQDLHAVERPISFSGLPGILHLKDQSLRLRGLVV